MSTADNLSRRMAELARDLQSEDTAALTMQHVVAASVELVDGCHSAAISLATRARDITTAATTDDVAVLADKLQQQLGEGPCIDAVWEEPLVSVPDLAVDPRWPTWGARAVEELGVRSMLCFQLFTHEDRLGALNLFAREPRSFDGADLDVGLAIAAHAAVAVVDAEKIEHLETALQNRTALGQATGLVMATYGLTDTGAFNLLRRLSSEQNRKMVVLARELVEQHNADRRGTV
jgi:GAF domain-containing protein